MYDSLGAAHTATVYFAKTATANQWNAYLTVDGQTVGAPTGADVLERNGALTTPANGKISFGPYTPTTGASALTMNFNLSNTTQYGDAFAVSSITAGRLHHRHAERHQHRHLRRRPGAVHQRQFGAARAGGAG